MTNDCLGLQDFDHKLIRRVANNHPERLNLAKDRWAYQLAAEAGTTIHKAPNAG